MSTHVLDFRAKIRDDVYPCKPQFYYIRIGCEGVQITQVCYHDNQGINDVGSKSSFPYNVYLQKVVLESWVVNLRWHYIAVDID